MKNFLIQDGWKTPDTYAGFYAKIPTNAGVYLFLKRWGKDLIFMDNPQILYIGMSKNLAKRMENHEIKKLITDGFFQVWFKLFSETDLRKVEKALIIKYNPPYNIIHRVRGT